MRCPHPHRNRQRGRVGRRRGGDQVVAPVAHGRGVDGGKVVRLVRPLVSDIKVDRVKEVADLHVRDVEKLLAACRIGKKPCVAIRVAHNRIYAGRALVHAGHRRVAAKPDVRRSSADSLGSVGVVVPYAHAGVSETVVELFRGHQRYLGKVRVVRGEAVAVEIHDSKTLGTHCVVKSHGTHRRVHVPAA